MRRAIQCGLCVLPLAALLDAQGAGPVSPHAGEQATPEAAVQAREAALAAVLRRNFSITVTQPARAGMPIWVTADMGANPEVEARLAARYPYRGDPRYFARNELQVKQNGVLLRPQPLVPNWCEIACGGWSGPDPSEVSTVLHSGPEGTPPPNRLPLHVAFPGLAPGHYSVRWVRQYTPEVVGYWPLAGLPPADPLTGMATWQSDWVKFDVVPAANGEQATWLGAMMAAPPTDADEMMTSYIPDLLAAPDDVRVRAALLELTNSEDSGIAECALGGLESLPANIQHSFVMQALRRGDLPRAVAYMIADHVGWYQDDRAEVVAAAIAALDSRDAATAEVAFDLLNLAGRFDWPAGAKPLAAANAAAAANRARFTGQEPTGDGTGHAPLAALFPRSLALNRAAADPVGQAVAALRADTSAGRQAAAVALLGIAMQPRSMEAVVGLGAYLDAPLGSGDDAVSAPVWRDAALLSVRVRVPGAYEQVHLAEVAPELAAYISREGAVAALVEMGDAAVPALNDVLQTAGPERRRLAAQALGAIGGADAAAALKAALQNEGDPETKVALQQALQHLGRRPPAAAIE